MSTKKKSSTASRPFRVRKSTIHGRGVFAVRKIRKGARIAEYKGELITWEEAERRYPVDPVPYHTFLFEVGDGSYCMDGTRRGSPAKWLNHSCKPNCEAEEDEDERVFIVALRDIAADEELTYDYNLTFEERISKAEQKRRYPCWCGAKKCRGTMLGLKP
jgi:SET domain-containing protein